MTYVDTGPRRMPTKRKIQQYWVDRLDLAAKGFDSREEFLESQEYCWACGMEPPSGKTQRAHIIPRVQQRQYEPLNRPLANLHVASNGAD